MKTYQSPAIKVMVNAIAESFIAASSDFTIGSDDIGVMPIIPGGGNPGEAI